MAEVSGTHLSNMEDIVLLRITENILVKNYGKDNEIVHKVRKRIQHLEEHG